MVSVQRLITNSINVETRLGKLVFHNGSGLISFKLRNINVPLDKFWLCIMVLRSLNWPIHLFTLKKRRKKCNLE